MEQNNDAPHGEPADNKRRIATLETALDDLIRRVPSLSGESLQQAKQDFLQTAARANSDRSIAERWQNSWTRGKEQVTTLITDQPARAIGIALGLGIIVGARCFLGRHPTDD